MHDIAGAAGYTTPTLYAYFRGKQAIIDALADSIEAEFHGLSSQPFPEGLTLEQRLEFVLQRQLSWCDERRDAFAALMNRPPQIAASRPIDGASMSVTHYRNLLAEYAVDGKIGPLAVECAAYFLWGITHALFTRAANSPTPIALATEARLVVRLFLRGVTDAPT